jgi:hypothetical protein
MNKLSIELVDQRLFDRNIKRINDYPNNRTKITFQCLIQECQYIWQTTTNHILNGGTGCPKCSGYLKLTNEIIDGRLRHRNIQRVSDYVKVQLKVKFLCLIDNCGCIWEALTDSVLRGSGCPRCNKNEKLTDERIDELLQNRNIKRVDNCINARHPIKFQCLLTDCQNVWKASPYAVLNSETGCPRCSLRKNEKMVFHTLTINGIFFEAQRIFRDKNGKVCVDFYLSEMNTIIEYNGAQHYQPVRFGGISQDRADMNFTHQQVRDERLRQFCKINDINLICIDGREYSNSKLEDYLIKHIIPMLKASKNEQ